MIPKYQIYDTEHQVVLDKNLYRELSDAKLDLGFIWTLCGGSTEDFDPAKAKEYYEFRHQVAVACGYDRRGFTKRS